LEVLDGVVFLKRLRYQGKYVRRVDKIYEIIGFNKEKKDVDRIISFKWDPRDDSYIPAESYILNKIAEIRNWNKSDIETNFEFKTRVLEYMLRNNIRNYRKIAEIMNMYYNNPDKLMSLIGF
jgi:flagellar protein FlaI